MVKKRVKLNRKLTDEQQKLIMENIGLAYKFARSNSPPYGVDQEDWESECIYVLCLSAITYNKSIARFSTYSYEAMIKLRIKLNESNKRPCRDGRRTQPLSLEEADRISAKPERDMVEIRDMCRWCLAVLDVRDRKILIQRSQGRLLKEIGKEMGVYRQRIEQLEKAAIRKVVIKRGLHREPAV